MRESAVLLLLLAGACASAPPSGGSGSSTPAERRTTSTTVTYTGPTGAPVNINLESNSTLETRSFHMQSTTPRELWQAVALAYPDVGVPLAAYDSTDMYIGNPGLAVSGGRVGTARVSRYLNCGTDPLGAALADRYAVRLSVVSRVRPDPGGSVLQTQVSGEASQRGVSGTVVNCASTGQLEEAIANAARIRLAGGHPN